MNFLKSTTVIAYIRVETIIQMNYVPQNGGEVFLLIDLLLQKAQEVRIAQMFRKVARWERRWTFLK